MGLTKTLQEFIMAAIQHQKQHQKNINQQQNINQFKSEGASKVLKSLVSYVSGIQPAALSK